MKCTCNYFGKRSHMQNMMLPASDKLCDSAFLEGFALLGVIFLKQAFWTCGHVFYLCIVVISSLCIVIISPISPRKSDPILKWSNDVDIWWQATLRDWLQVQHVPLNLRWDLTFDPSTVRSSKKAHTWFLICHVFFVHASGTSKNVQSRECLSYARYSTITCVTTM